MSELTVGSVARLAGVTVRTLHHYDDIGLVVPAGRTESGYRTYGSGEVERLQEVLFFRELGFSLEKIREIVGRPGYSRSTALKQQREMLEARAEHLSRMIDAVDHAIAAEQIGETMSNEDMLEVFGDFDPAEYEEEAKERWGDTDAYKQSAQRTARYTKDDWKAVQAEVDGIYQGLVKLMAAGTPADDPEAMGLAEQHRLHISSRFYDCSKEMHAGLGQMYVADVRFKENIDKAGEGLAEYLSAAIAANAAR
jgi:DNA-binding transcriptional MerR regulator